VDCSKCPSSSIQNEEEALHVSLLDLPSSTKKIVINVGSNLDPIMLQVHIV